MDLGQGGLKVVSREDAIGEVWGDGGHVSGCEGEFHRPRARVRGGYRVRAMSWGESCGEELRSKQVSMRLHGKLHGFGVEVG